MMENSKPLFLLEKDLSYKLQGLFIAISREHGHLYKEKVYYNILKNKLKGNGLTFVQNPRIAIYDLKSGEIIGNYYPDFLIENKIIIEIKAQNQILDTHINQLIRYLNSSKYEVGYLVNFGTPKAQIIRRVYSNQRKLFLHRLNTNGSPMAR